ncbi:MAG: 50S ribosomal protein L9 [Chloroflexota bacterium]
MRVIFLQDVLNVAKAGEVKDVADGYGRNYLIPLKLAMLANAPAVGLEKARREIATSTQARTEASLAEMAEQADGVEITLEARAGAKDRLYGSITSADIAAELEKSIGQAIDKKKIELAEPIHKLGGYDVTIRLAKGIVSKIRVNVVAKGTLAQAEAEVEEEAEAEVEEEAEAEAEEEAEAEVEEEAEAEVEVEEAEAEAEVEEESQA